MTLAVIALGSNIDAPKKRLSEAYGYLKELSAFSVVRASPIYQSPPMGPQDQPPFFNAVVSGYSTAEPLALLSALQDIEKSIGRVKKRHWGERRIDLDIIQFGDRTINLPNLRIPHPGIANRLFVVQPMLDILGVQHKVPGLPELGNLRKALNNEELSFCSDAALG